MGNFRHQSLRTNDRDRDRDSERERERDLRDREGQERLRNVSVVYEVLCTKLTIARSSLTSMTVNASQCRLPHQVCAARNATPLPI